MKTSELTGALLDYWVARAELIEFAGRPLDEKTSAAVYKKIGLNGLPFNPSDNWEQGGPIIERERIAIWGYQTNFAAAHPNMPEHGYYDAKNGVIDIGGDGQMITGKTPLIAAMRAYVASKFGDEVPENDV